MTKEDEQSRLHKALNQSDIAGTNIDVLLLPSASAWFGYASGVEPMLIAIDEARLSAIEHV